MFIPFWSQISLQEALSSSMELMVYFHDYMMLMLCLIMGFVSYMFVLVSVVSYIDKVIVESHFLELVWTVVPMFFLLLMAFPSLYLLYLTEDFSIAVCTFKAIGHQWYWEYEGASSDSAFDSYMLTSSELRNLDVDNRVVVPYGANTVVLVTSSDVLHSWTVPSLGVKADAIPGRLNYLGLSPLSAGVVYGQCSELCGSNHSFMPIVLEVVSPLDFIYHQS